ncbi:MAG: hypothetical protein ISR59_13735 [Anaerolineales bacterium]|uniref:Histidine kinase domain-containing protein n=1 Tax=Candidatus Desulfolinea nitratireducens TaxID=2841698 RepID=A0A8J6TEI4_9CHLR|nr:hypothetical protein [Candidatus Desulfolinea nitratireducens]MBL6962163.1 hypothetical protein [Anaerolineales bacterium]
MPTFYFSNDLSLILLLAGGVFVIGMFLLRIQKQRQSTNEEIENTNKNINASFSLSGYLLAAHNEEAVIMAAMRSGFDLLEAEGSAFVPFNEWKQSVTVLKHGDFQFLQEPVWQTRLTDPATRHSCRNCKDKEAGMKCILLPNPADADRVYCLALRCGGREIGVLNYFFHKPPKITGSQELFLSELVRLTDLRLDALHAHSQELDSLRQGRQPALSKEEFNSLNAENKELLVQLEYQAVLKERTRLAREIHDGLAQTLAFLKMETARMQIQISKGEIASIDQALQACHKTLSEAYLDARQSIDNLRRAPDEKFSDWLETTASDFKLLTDVAIDLSDLRLDTIFPDNIKAQLIRIVQEALTNIRKHALADMVSISAFERADEIILEIKDNGHGFTPEEVTFVSRYGLRSMRERAESIHADFQIISAPGAGTTISLKIPTVEKINL